MVYQSLIQHKTISILLVVQFVPLVLFPPSSFSLATQEWWLPVVLALLVAISVFQLLERHSQAQWPWYLISFAQGFNIISRLMMLMPHSTVDQDGQQVFNTLYVVLSVVSMALSAFLLWYTELPEVRLGVLKD